MATEMKPDDKNERRSEPNIAAIPVSDKARPASWMSKKWEKIKKRFPLVGDAPQWPLLCALASVIIGGLAIFFVRKQGAEVLLFALFITNGIANAWIDLYRGEYKGVFSALARTITILIAIATWLSR